MNEKQKKRNKIIGISIGILVVLLIVVSSTYAYWQITESQEGSNDIIAACLSIDMQSVDGTFSLDPAWPISDEEGMNLKGYTFKVTNNCEEDVNYIIGMDSLVKTGVEYLNYDSVKLSVDNNDPVIYGEQDDIDHIEENDLYQIRDSKKLYTAVVKGKVGDTPGENTHNVKVWIKSESELEDREKVFSGRMFITGGQKIDNDKPLVTPTSEACFEMNGEEIIGYNKELAECGESVVIPATVKGNSVKSIDSNAFKETRTIKRYINAEGEETNNLNVTNANIAFVKNGYTPGDSIDDTNISYVINLVNDDEINTIASKMGYDIYPEGEEPELEEGQLKVYQNLDKVALESTFEGAEYITTETNVSVMGLDLSKAYNLETIEASAFSNVPSYVVELDSYDNYNTSLTSLTFGNNDKEMYVGHNAFARIDVDNLDIYLTLYTGVDENQDMLIPFGRASIGTLNIIATDTKTIFLPSYNNDDITKTKAIPTKGIIVDNMNITEGITRYGNPSFINMEIGTLTLPNSVDLGVSSIGFGSTIKKIILPTNLIDIPQNSFAYVKVSDIVLPNTLKSIGSSAFDGSALKNIIIPKSVTSIGDEAFKATPNLSQINVEHTEEEFRNNVTTGDNWNDGATLIYES